MPRRSQTQRIQNSETQRMGWILLGWFPLIRGINVILMIVDRSWDEKQVISWLHTINCGQYESLFKGNHSFTTVYSIKRANDGQRITSMAITSSNATKRYYRRWVSKRLAIEFAFSLPLNNSGINRCIIASNTIW